MQDRVFTDEQIAWMAGLLEGEGYFFCNSKIGVRLVMTDEDVVTRFAELWGVKCKPRKCRAAHHKQPFSATLPKNAAIQCMKLILPYCGARRTETILGCLQKYAAQFVDGRARRALAHTKISNADLVEAWAGRDVQMSFRAFCRHIGISDRTGIYQRLQRLGAVETPLNPAAAEPSSAPPLDWNKVPLEVKTAWHAGLLEGEGSFGDSRGFPRVSLKMTDEDIVARFASDVGAERSTETPAQEHWKLSHICVFYGHRAATVMERVLPWMGERRTAKIRGCLTVRAESQARLAAQQSAHKVARETKLPAAELTLLWTTRIAPANLSSFAREYGVHPQIMKERLLALGVYSAPAYKPCTDVTHTCTICQAPFIRKASQKGGQYCSRVCSGRAAAQRRRASATA